MNLIELLNLSTLNSPRFRHPSSRPTFPSQLLLEFHFGTHLHLVSSLSIPLPFPYHIRTKSFSLYLSPSNTFARLYQKTPGIRTLNSSKIFSPRRDLLAYPHVAETRSVAPAACRLSNPNPLIGPREEIARGISHCADFVRNDVLANGLLGGDSVIPTEASRRPRRAVEGSWHHSNLLDPHSAQRPVIPSRICETLTNPSWPFSAGRRDE